MFKTLLTLHYTGWVIGIRIIMASYIPYKTGKDFIPSVQQITLTFAYDSRRWLSYPSNPLYTANNQGLSLHLKDSCMFLGRL